MPFILLLIFLGIVVSLYVAKTRNDTWSRVADDYGLTVVTKGLFSPSMSGTVDSMAVSARISSKGRNNNHTEILVEYPPAGPAFTISRDAAVAGQLLSFSPALHKIFRSVVGADVEIGDQVFDEAAQIDGDPAALAQFLTPERKLAITRVLSGYASAKISDHRIRIRLAGGIGDEDRLRHVLDAALAAGKAISARAAARPVPPPPAPTPEPASPPATEADPFDAWSHAHELPAAPPRAVPEPRRDGGRTEPDERPESVPDAIPAGHIDAGAMGRDLFESGRPGYEIEKRFAADYRGMPISWRGIILKQRPGSTELVVAEIEDRLFGRSSIVVTTDTSAPPGAGVGDEVVLDGTASDIDYLDRKVKVEGATLRA